MSDQGHELTINDIEEIRDLLECGMQEEAEALLINLASAVSHNENELVYSQVGNLTRDLHDALKRFAEDDRLRVIANIDMPKASERLSSIISMTDSAASRTLDAVDKCEPMVKKLQDSIDKLMPAWNSLMRGRIKRETFVSLCRNVDTLIHNTQESADEVVAQLNIILMAQDYQDLTGQMIQKVITLVSEVEDKLLQFLMHFSDEEKKAILENHELVSGIAPQGPSTGESMQSENVAANQDDVDDLLASLGF